MLQLKNNTPFQSSIFVFPNEQGIDTLYVVVKATFAVGDCIEVAETQRPVVMADEPWGEPGKSSVKYASEAHLSKPATDVVLVGEACAPDGRRVTQLDVLVAVAEKKKTVRVFGGRRWEKRFLAMRMTDAAPFDSMPLTYERAFGGLHVVDQEKNKIMFEPRNPVGCGFAGKRNRTEIDGMKLPNLEDPSQLITKPSQTPKPAGFGFISPAWEPRRSFAGTYDEAWQKKRAPYLPDDFQRRHFNGAHPDLIFVRYLTGGETIEVLNASPRGPFRLKVPFCQVRTTLRVVGKVETIPLNLETVLLEPSAANLCLTWRAAFPCDKKALKIEQVELKLEELELFGRAA